MDVREVEQLMSVAIGTARLLGFTIAPNCQGHLASSLQLADLNALPLAQGESGVAYPTDHVTRMSLAQARVAQFTAAMATHALHNGLPADMALHEDNFFGAKGWICPLWPVC